MSNGLKSTHWRPQRCQEYSVLYLLDLLQGLRLLLYFFGDSAGHELAQVMRCKIGEAAVLQTWYVCHAQVLVGFGEGCESMCTPACLEFCFSCLPLQQTSSIRRQLYPTKKADAGDSSSTSCCHTSSGVLGGFFTFFPPIEVAIDFLSVCNPIRSCSYRSRCLTGNGALEGYWAEDTKDAFSVCNTKESSNRLNPRLSCV